ncbi:hypothetical protein Nepgr_013284 [Nepenthes gracilis]|uniref:Uncharacterized protein n=1 Tax=Nepenthes gracilis TaxID=150966 RepID=A0AAD3XNV0_NEPGR|nr:hypothetical protein Nepgr_013284 [Nepenthes gracilis]
MRPPHICQPATARLLNQLGDSTSYPSTEFSYVWASVTAEVRAISNVASVVSPPISLQVILLHRRRPRRSSGDVYLSEDRRHCELLQRKKQHRFELHRPTPGVVLRRPVSTKNANLLPKHNQACVRKQSAEISVANNGVVGQENTVPPGSVEIKAECGGAESVVGKGDGLNGVVAVA